MHGHMNVKFDLLVFGMGIALPLCDIHTCCCATFLEPEMV